MSSKISLLNEQGTELSIRHLNDPSNALEVTTEDFKFLSDLRQDPPSSVGSNFVSVSDYEGATDTIQIQAALNGAMSEGKGLLFERGQFYSMDLSPTNPIGLQIESNGGILFNDDIEIDFNYSTIQVNIEEANLEQFIANFIKIDELDSGEIGTVILKNAVINAPLNFDQIGRAVSTFDFDAMKDSVSGYTYISCILYKVGSVNLILDNFNIRGYWYGAIQGSGGLLYSDINGEIRPKRLEIRNSTLEALGTVVGTASAGANGLELIVDNSKFYGHNDQGSNWTDRGRIIYPTSQTSVRVTNSLLKGAGRTQFHHYSTTVSSVSIAITKTLQAPAFCVFESVVFEISDSKKSTELNINGGLFTTDMFTRTFLVNCTFDGTFGVQGRCGSTLIGCKAINGGTLLSVYSHVPYLSTSEQKQVLIGCSADRSFTTQATINVKYISVPDQNIRNIVEVYNSTFNDCGIAHTGSASNDSLGTLVLSGCSFYSSDPVKPSTLNLIRCGGEYLVEGCVFRGISTGFFTNSSNSDDSLGIINNNKFFLKGYRGITFTANPLDGETITIGTNTYTFGSLADIDIESDVKTTVLSLFSHLNQNSANDEIEFSLSLDGLTIYVVTDISNTVVSSIVTGVSIGSYTYSRVSSFSLTDGDRIGSNNYFNPLIQSGISGRSSLSLSNSYSSVTIGSNALINLDPNYNSFLISGSSTISTIRIGLSNSIYLINEFTGSTITLIVDVGGTWSLGDTSNIIPLNTSPRTAGDKITLLLVDTGAGTNRWKEI